MALLNASYSVDQRWSLSFRSWDHRYRSFCVLVAKGASEVGIDSRKVTVGATTRGRGGRSLAAVALWTCAKLRAQAQLDLTATNLISFGEPGSDRVARTRRFHANIRLKYLGVRTKNHERPFSETVTFYTAQ